MADPIVPNVVVSMPSQLFTLARSFKAAANGKIYIGKIDTDPTIPENQIQVYVQNENDSLVPISQPIVINAGGYPVYGGQISKFVTVEGHSMAVYDAYNVQQFYFHNVLRYDPDQLRQQLAGPEGAKLVGFDDSNVYDTLKGLSDNMGYLTPEMFYQDSDGGNDSISIQKMCDEMRATGRKGVLRSGKTYNLSTSVDVELEEGNIFSLDATGAVVKQITDITTLTIRNKLVGGIANVSAIENVVRNLGDGNTNTLVTKMTAPGHPFTAPGQIGKIFSDDVVPDTDASGQFCGEFFVVGDIDGNDVYTTGVVEEKYQSAIKICRPSTAQVSIYDFNGLSEWQDSFKEVFIVIRGLISPKLFNFSAKDINSAFLNVTSCYRAEIDKITGYRIKNRPDLEAYGYLVNDSSSFASKIGAVIGVYARHAYTTTSSRAAAGDNQWDRRGRTIDSQVDYLFGQGCANAADTHSPALRITFNSVICKADYRGNSTGGAGIQLRGNSCVVNDAEVHGSRIGIAFSGADKTSDSVSLVRSIRIFTPAGHTPILVNGSTTYFNKVYFGSVYVNTNHDSILQITNTDVVIDRLDGAFNPYQNGGALVVLNDASAAEILNGNITLLGATNSHVLAKHSTTLTRSRFNLKVTGVTGRLSYLASSASQYDIESDMSALLDSALTGIPFSGYADTLPKVRAKIQVGFNARPLGYRAITYAVAGNQTVNLQFAGESVVYLRAEVTTPGVAINAVTQGAFPGQQLVINNRNASTSTLRLQNNGAGMLPLTTSVDIPVGQGVTLIWDGANWRYANLI